MVTHPDAPGALLHFTGRTRRLDDQPPAFAAGSPQQRLARILELGWLFAAGTYGTVGPVLCFSELSDVALSVLLTTGLNGRGPYPPWGLVLDRHRLVQLGVGPVWYMSDSDYAQTHALPPQLADRRVRSNPGGFPDWTGEREWRLCWGSWPSVQPAIQLTADRILAVVVGTPGWQPGWESPAAAVPAMAGVPCPTWCIGVTRWLWTGGGLVVNGALGA